MSIVNFAVSKPLEQKINQTIKEYGFASKAEFFRFAAMNFISKDKTLPLENDPGIAYLTSEIKKLTKKITGKKLPSLKKQLSDL